ncbi:SDR family NAD(P)-dependent oxidoreductase [Piscinibacter aquaticus]|uniref:SDR family NAD(P)-dependent oxidoreductase n=1 Tax=Piscinibacter aquaticus TaxID=392597 RepID=A0A5C6U096_9BURK|nr:SDR family NAD(P)-dependent oxidoreductase [Piscinibacter aquaticus]
MTTPGTVVIAGHAAGLGESLRARFEHGGYHVACVSRSGDARWATDLSDAQAVAELFQRLDREMPPLAGVVHNAMQFHRQPFLETSAQTLSQVWQSMVLTAFNVSQQAIPRLRAGAGGCLIFSGASGSRRAGPQFSAFSSAKFALRGLAQALAREHASDGVHVVHVVINGLIRGERTSQRFAQAQPAGQMDPDALAEQYWHLFHQGAQRLDRRD